jgi:hypothetical protein
LAGGVNLYLYADGDPATTSDPLGLKPRDRPAAQPGGNSKDRRQNERHGPGPLPLPPRGDNLRDAAGFFQPPPLTMVCMSWICDRGPECRPEDMRRPSDFIPAARLVSDGPAGCRCLQPVPAQDWTGPRPPPSVDDVLDAAGWSYRFWRGR